MTTIEWISHACFHVSHDDRHVYFDPYKVPTDMPVATLILISHEHYDHADAPSITRLQGPRTIIACPASCTGSLSSFAPVGLKVGEERSFAGIRVAPVPACTFPGKKFHPRENGWLGYVVDVGDTRVYHAGDTDIMDDMAVLASMNIDVALLPVGNKGYTMDFTDAAKATAMISPRIVVPMHDWDQDLEPFRDLVSTHAPGVAVEILRGKPLIT